ncbi:MAG: hypothetical protein QM539_10570 [Alphaproteobacteria bacterium]|nr:hypothetical protein [Alphaproteobacteria bacterium]
MDSNNQFLKIIYFFCLFFIFSCDNSEKHRNSDSTKLMFNNSNDSLDETIDYVDVENQFKSIYNTTTKIDTIISDNNNKFRLILNHYCLFDSFYIPSKYNWNDDSKGYIGHNFNSKILLIKNSDTILNTLVTKSIFKYHADNSLQKYGILFAPNFITFNPYSKSFILNYSYSIPMTDVGIGVHLSIDSNDKINIFQ